MASTRLIKGILGAIDERLGTGLFQAEGRSLAGSGAKLVGRAPVRGILSPEVLPKDVHPDVILRSEPLQRMFHASNSRASFDRPTGDLNDVGLHLTRSPDIADMFSMGLDTRDPHLLNPSLPNQGISLSGPRVYPMLVDPGRTLKEFPTDPRDWNNPHEIASMMDNEVLGKYATYPEGYNDPAMKEIRDRLGSGQSFKEAMQGIGHDSAEYTITSPYTQNPEHALILMDPSRAVPEYTRVGQKAAKTRGVMAAEKGATTTPEEVALNLREFTGMGVPESYTDPNQFLSEVWHPSEERLQGQIDQLQRWIANKEIGPEAAPHFKMKIDQIKDYLKQLGYK